MAFGRRGIAARWRVGNARRGRPTRWATALPLPDRGAPTHRRSQLEKRPASTGLISSAREGTAGQGRRTPLEARRSRDVSPLTRWLGSISPCLPHRLPALFRLAGELVSCPARLWLARTGSAGLRVEIQSREPIHLCCAVRPTFIHRHKRGHPPHVHASLHRAERH